MYFFNLYVTFPGSLVSLLISVVVGVMPAENFAQSGLAISILTSNTLLAKRTHFIYMNPIHCVKRTMFCTVFFFYILYNSTGDVSCGLLT